MKVVGKQKAGTKCRRTDKYGIYCRCIYVSTELNSEDTEKVFFVISSKNPHVQARKSQFYTYVLDIAVLFQDEKMFKVF